MMFCGYASYSILVNQAAMLMDFGSPIGVATVISISFGVCVVAKILLGMIVDKAGAPIGFAIACISLILACISLLSAKTAVAAILFAVFFAFGQLVLTVPLASMVQKVVGAKKSVAFIGYFTGFMTIGSIISSILAPKLFDLTGHYTSSVIVAICCAAIGFVLLQIAMKFGPKYVKDEDK